MRLPVDTFDLSSLTELSESSISEVLQRRYEADRIYTLVGDILIFVNPFKPVGVYTDKEFSCFCSPDWAGRVSVGDELDSTAHIYGVGSAAFGLRGADAAILISGESGSGKTESTKLLLQQFVRMAGSSKLNRRRVADCLLAANPVMEAFGNARTAMNHNSSRFAKFVSVGLSDSALVSSDIRAYMLEKSRLVGCGGDEGNYHVLYYLCLSQHAFLASSRPPELQKQQLSLLSNRDSMRELYGDVEARTQELLDGFDKLGFSAQQKVAVFQILSGLLLLGNAVFVTEELDHSAQTSLSPSSEATFKLACKQLGLKGKEARRRLLKTLTTSKLQVNNEDIYAMYQEDRTRVALNGCIRSVYSRLFDWLIASINEQLAAAGDAAGAGGGGGGQPRERRQIGVLDIFGFESLAHNSFEQLCINLANEQLQLFFTHHVIRLEQQQYQAEGVAWTEIAFDDNQATLDLFLDRPLGVLSLLNEESSLASGTDEGLFRKLLQHLGDRQALGISERSAAQFSVRHFAGDVAYAVPGLVDKNRDRPPQATLEALAAASKNKVLVELLLGDAKGKRQQQKQQQKQQQQQKQLAVQFRSSLDFLLQKLRESRPFFVRCVKPNRDNVADRFSGEYVGRQIRYCGIAEAVRVRRTGYSVRFAFDEASAQWPAMLRLRGARNVRQLLPLLLAPGDFAIGRTKLFLKASASRQLLVEEQRMVRRIVTCQKVVRGFLQRRKFARLKEQRRKQKQQQQQQAAIESSQSLASSSDAGDKEVSRKDTIRWFRGTQRQQLQGCADYQLWFHGIISRKDTNALLMPKTVGSFLIRVSNSRLGFVLSFKGQESMRHYLIEQMKNGRFAVVGEGRVHRSLADLVDFHKKNGFRNCDVLLTQPVGQQPDQEPDYCDLF